MHEIASRFNSGQYWNWTKAFTGSKRNIECRMTKEASIPNSTDREPTATDRAFQLLSDFGFRRSFGFRHSSFVIRISAFGFLGCGRSILSAKGRNVQRSAATQP